MELVARHDWSSVIINQPYYNMLGRDIEKTLLPHVEEYGVGVIVFSPLAQGRLTSKYLDPKNPIPKNSRAADPDGFLQEDQVTQDTVERVRKLSKLAEARGQTMAQMAIAWTLRDSRITSSLIGARTPEQVTDSLGALKNTHFSEEELRQIDEIVPLA
jgi:L-glyceraldehyde 3-phosphate reductase